MRSTSERIRSCRRVAAALSIMGCLLAGCGDAGEGRNDPHAGEAPAGGGELAGEIHLDADQRASIGLMTVVAGPGEIRDVLRVPGTVTFNEDDEAHVNPRVSGVVRVVHKGLGDQVEAGDLLVEIESVELGNAVADAVRQRARLKAAESMLANEKRLFEARIETWKRVADAAIAVAERIRARESGLQEQGISTLRPLLEAEKELQQAQLTKDKELTGLESERDARILELGSQIEVEQIELAAAHDRLRVLGLPEEKLGSLAGLDEGSYGILEVRAPIAGWIVQRDVTLDEFVQPSQTLFRLENLATVWVIARVYEKDLARVRTGQEVEIRLDAIPGSSIQGTVDVIGFEFSEDTRAVPVRIVVPNRPLEGWDEEYPLRPGMYGSVSLVLSSSTVGVVIPEEAIVHEGDRTAVFVEEEPGHFASRSVHIRTSSGQDVEVIAGLEPGEVVVTKGSFVLKSIARAGELGEHGH